MALTVAILIKKMASLLSMVSSLSALVIFCTRAVGNTVVPATFSYCEIECLGLGLRFVVKISAENCQ
jgi:hypothetical protein